MNHKYRQYFTCSNSIFMQLKRYVNSNLSLAYASSQWLGWVLHRTDQSFDCIKLQMQAFTIVELALSLFAN